MHTHPGQPPAGPSGRGSRCGATARAALPAAQTKQSALAVSAAQFQMPRPARRALIGPQARGSRSPGKALGAAVARGRSSELFGAGSTWGDRRGEREERERQTHGERQTGTETFPKRDSSRDKGRARNIELY